MEEGYGEVPESDDSSRRGIRGHKQAERSSTRSNMVKRPICHADEGPVGLCEQAFGTTGTAGQQTGQWGDYRSRRGGQVHGRMDDICYTMFEVPMETRLNPLPPPLPVPPARAARTHHALTAW